jgi:hypothetical protein
MSKSSLWPPFSEDYECERKMRSRFLVKVERPPVIVEQDEKATTSSPELLPGHGKKAS